MRPSVFCFAALCWASLVACSTPPQTPGQAPQPAATPSNAEASQESAATAVPPPATIVAASDRTEADRALDAGRHPRELLELLDLKPGNRVADLMAGTGYTTELLARSVGPTGAVYGQNNPFMLKRYAERPWSQRLARPVNTNVIRLDREIDDPLGDVTDLDAVSLVLFYHDTVWMQTDRKAMNAAIFGALRPGGSYLVVDHSAQKGAGLRDAKTLHRIEASTVLEEVKAAGFELSKTADFLGNADDTRDWNASPSAAGERRGTSDRFVLLFKKPLG